MHISATALATNARSLTLLAFVLSAASICSAANITYNVNLTIGSGSATGDIVTDGTIGFLTKDDIVDWNLLLNTGTTSFDVTNQMARSPESPTLLCLQQRPSCCSISML